jgi:cell shape-determining protein MreD
MERTRDTSERKELGDRLLTYAGIAGIAIALVLTVAVVALTVAPALLPSGTALGALASTVLLVVVFALVRYLHRQRGRTANPDPDWH